MKQLLYICLVFWGSCFYFITCHAEITINDYLATAFKDEALVYQTEKIAFLKNSSSNTPYINEVELRMQIDEFEDSKHKYTVRMNMNGWGEHSQGKKVYEASLKYNETERAILLNDSLKDRYIDIIGYNYLEMLMVLKDSLMHVYTDRVEVLKKSVGTLQFDAVELIDTERELLDLQLDMVNIKNEKVVIEEKIKLFFSTENEDILIIKDMIDIYSIQDKIIKLKGSFEQKNVHIQHGQYNFEMADAKYKLEQAENKTYLSFLEASYDMDQKEKFEKAFTFEFGVTIPIVNPNRLDINRRKLNSLKAKSNWMNVKKNIQMNFYALSRKIKRLITQYDIISMQKKKSRTEETFDIFRQMDGANPLILLKLKESMLKNEITLLKIQHQIYETYIKLLDCSGELSSTPLINYLSKNSESLSVP
ncbi:conserved hypothetical protein, secreted [Candidatus Magnetomorum sp. HK-1]|nr:conserved hypothetical protein, secreted [Candidatus Magnetomorum sp. HK-1]